MSGSCVVRGRRFAQPCRKNWPIPPGPSCSSEPRSSRPGASVLSADARCGRALLAGRSIAGKVSCVPTRALFHTAPRCVEVREVPTPRPAAGEVLVRTVCSGISGGTERLVYRGEVPAELALDDTIDALSGAFSYPFAYGYACVGEVAGSRQAVFAFHPHQDVFAARAEELVPLPAAIDPAPATLFPLVETALQVTLDAGTGYRDRVIVLGAGVLGLLTGLLLRRSGRRPLGAEPQPWRRELAGRLGVTAVPPGELASQEVPLVIDASGSPDAPAPALSLLAHEGTLLV